MGWRDAGRHVAGSLTERGTDGREHFVGGGDVASVPVVGPDDVSSDGDLNDAAAALDKTGCDAGISPDGVRQTGGPGLVVSLHAVLDANVLAHAR